MDLEPLRTALGPAKVALAAAERHLYRYDAITSGALPLAVVFPESPADLVTITKFASQNQIPLVGRGSGSGLSGGAVPSVPAIVVAFTRMDRLEIDPARRRASAEPGVITARVNREAAQHGLFYPPDPASLAQSSIGGNLAENAGGPSCFKWGVSGDYVRALTAVTIEGEVLRLQRGAYDLAGLLIGSEGTLALIAEAELELLPLPRYSRTLRATFTGVEPLAQAVAEAIAWGAVPAKLEFMDQACLRAVEAAFGFGLPVEAGAMLLVDTQGDYQQVVDEELELVAEAVLAYGGQVQLARDHAEAEALWRARRSVSPALGRIRPQRMNEDIVVPRSQLPAVVSEIQALGAASGFPLVLFGHIGDGNLHPNILYDPRSDDVSAVHDLALEVAKVALKYGGVLSGEHGIGLMKRDFMPLAVDPDTLNYFRALKSKFDPANLLNPGKVLP